MHVDCEIVGNAKIIKKINTPLFKTEGFHTEIGNGRHDKNRMKHHDSRNKLGLKKGHWGL